MQVKQRDMVLSLIAGRAAPESTEAFLRIAGADQPILLLDI